MIIDNFACTKVPYSKNIIAGLVTSFVMQSITLAILILR